MLLILCILSSNPSLRHFSPCQCTENDGKQPPVRVALGHSDFVLGSPKTESPSFHFPFFLSNWMRS